MHHSTTTSSNHDMHEARNPRLRKKPYTFHHTLQQSSTQRQHTSSHNKALCHQQLLFLPLSQHDATHTLILLQSTKHSSTQDRTIRALRTNSKHFTTHTSHNMAHGPLPVLFFTKPYNPTNCMYRSGGPVDGRGVSITNALRISMYQYINHKSTRRRRQHRSFQPHHKP